MNGHYLKTEKYHVRSKLLHVAQGSGREKNQNRADFYLRSILFSFESGRLLCSILVTKMTVRL